MRSKINLADILYLLCLLFLLSAGQGCHKVSCDDKDLATLVTTTPTYNNGFVQPADTTSQISFAIDVNGIFTDTKNGPYGRAQYESFDFITSDGLLIYQGQIGNTVHVVLNRNSTPSDATVILRAPSQPNNNVLVMLNWRCGSQNWNVKYANIYQLSLRTDSFSVSVTRPIQVIATLSSPNNVAINAPGIPVQFTVIPTNTAGSAPATTTYHIAPTSFSYFAGQPVLNTNTKMYEWTTIIAISNTTGAAGAGNVWLNANVDPSSGLNVQNSSLLLNWY